MIRDRVGPLTLASIWLVAIACACTAKIEDLPQSVTYYEHIEPLIYRSCSSCHRPGESAPFPLLTYDHAERRAQQISQSTRSGYMPPWMPSGGDHAFEGARSLTPREIELIRLWVKQGAVAGDAAHHRDAPTWPEGWQLGRPDLIVEMDQPYLLDSELADVYRNFVLPIPVDRPRWVRAVELRPGNKRVVHHAIVRVDPTASSRRSDAREPGMGFGGMEMGDAVPPDGQFIGWTPGRLPTPPDPTMAWRLEPGTDLVLQMHMLPTGKPESILPSVGLYFTDVEPTRRPTIVSLDDREIDIPAGDANHIAEDAMLLPVAVEVLSIYPHAHFLGKTMTITAEPPGRPPTTLLEIDDWDFDWQDEYRYLEPVRLPAGTTIRMRYRFDNSAANERNPSSPPVRVKNGNSSKDEMATLALQVLTANEQDRARLDEAQFRHILTKDPGHAAAHNDLGSSLLRRREPAEAIEHLRQAIAFDPGMEQAHYNLGVALQAMGDAEGAIDAYRRALSINELFAPAENNLGNLLFAAGESEQALLHYRRALELRPGFDEAHYNLGSALLELGRLVEAEQQLRLALAADPGHPMTHNNLAVALYSGGRRNEALGLLERALELDPQLIEAHLNLARLLTESGEGSAAAAHLQRILELDSDNVAARAALTEIER